MREDMIVNTCTFGRTSQDLFEMVSSPPGKPAQCGSVLDQTLPGT